MIKIGASGVIFQDRFTLDCHVVETRQYPYRVSDCWGVTQKALNNGIYLIFNICWENGYNPTDEQWRYRVEDVVQKLISYGGNKKNCRITIINEPMKYISKEKYAHLINIAYSQVRGRFLVGAGNEEFLLAQAKGNMYEYILNHSNFDVLDIHIQGSCLKESDCSKWTNLALNWATSHKKILDCTEANYSDVAKESGYKTLTMQVGYAEKVGCIHVAIVFIGLSNEEKYRWLSFIYNGKVRSPYWEDFKRIMKEKAPIPEPIIERSKDGMIIRTIGFKNTDLKSGYPVLLVNELLYQNNFLSADKVGYSYTEDTKQGAIDFINHIREKYPNDPVKQLLKSDGRIGRQTYRYLVEEILDPVERKKYQFAIQIMTSPINIKGAGI